MPEPTPSSRKSVLNPEPGEDARFPHWRRNMRVLFVANIFLTSGFGVSYPFLPLVLRDLGVQGDLEIWVGYTVGSFFTISFFVTPVWGVFADHFGRKPMVLRAGFGMGLISLAMALATEPWMFIALFMAMGCTNGFVPASLALVATNTPTRYMGKALSLLHSGALLGNTLGPAVGGILAAFFPAYHYLFAVTGVFILIAGTLALLFVRERTEAPTRPFRLHLVRDLNLLVRIPGMAGLYGLTFLFSLSFFGSSAVVSVYTLNLLDESSGAPFAPSFMGAEAFWIGVVAMAMAVSSAVALPFWGLVLDRLETSRVLALGFLVATLGSLPVIFVGSPIQLALARLMFGVLACGIGPTLVATIKSKAPPGMDARTLSYGTSFGMLGTGAGPLLGGIIGPAYGLRTYFGINSVLLLLGAIAWLRVGMGARIGAQRGER